MIDANRESANERWTFRSGSEADTHRLGIVIGRALRGGEVISLIGQLGAGKTRLVQGIARGLEVPEDAVVTSPTFTLVNEYAGRIYLYHLDAYRLKSTLEFQALGIDEMIAPDAAAVVEWGDRVAGALPDDRLDVLIAPDAATTRTFRFHAQGAGAARLLTAVQSAQVDTD